jgi:hypothetical protein
MEATPRDMTLLQTSTAVNSFIERSVVVRGD